MIEILSNVELKGLKDHKYSVAGTTLLDSYMQVYWRWLVEQIPLWWAPNALTLIGLILNISTTLVIVFYSPDGKQEAPSWAYFVAALGLFLYQSLDAIDGKQARRTNSASPLGELFDHGCDAVSCVTVMTGFAVTLQLGYEPNYFLFMLAFSMFMFYTAHWNTYCTGTLKFGLFDVTEAQFGIIIVYILGGIFGPSMWSSQVPMLGIQLKVIPYVLALGGSFIAAYGYFNVIFVQGGVGKGRSTVAGTSVLGPAVPIGLTMGSMYYIAAYTESLVFYRHPVLYILTFGMTFSKITCKLVVAHMSRSEMELLDSSFVAPLLLVINQNMHFLLPEYFLLWVAFMYTSIDLWLYASRVCRQICDYLDIYCFKITASPSAAAATKSSSAASATPRRTTNGTSATSSVTSGEGPRTRSASRMAQQRR